MTMNTFQNRKTIRKYARKEVSDQLLNRLLETAERTPTMGNLQLYSVVVTRSKERKEQLSPAHFNQPTAWAEQRKATPGYDNFLSFMNASTDALLYTQTFCNLAEAEGLGTCFLGTTLYMPQMIIDILKLPRLVFPVATITLGWPDENPALTDRLPLRAIMHQETFNDYTSNCINDIYHEKETLAENKHFVEINHKETLAQVFTDLRYTKKDNEEMSKVFMEALKKQGFL